MNTQGFLQTLAQYPEKALVFQHGEGQRIPPGYHVTEIMDVRYASMDCGGQANAWRETVIQLMDPRGEEEAVFMPVRKFLSIYRRVAASVALEGAAELRFEYGNPALRYRVGGLEVQGEALVVHLLPPQVACKAADRAEEAGCCDPGLPLRLNARPGH
ncbi:DUF6428 family protein [Thermus oshimai]|jgi:hypothetical protein|uniref:DUF6428 family protein n=1 Tax=Thermus oshimai TaxID=56957 RepID=UPI0031FADCFC